MSVVNTAKSKAHRDYTLTDAEFARLRELVYDITGISLNDSKRDLVYSRFTKRLRALQLASFTEYCDLVSSGEIDEHEEFANAITTNLTSFFRERHHFSYLAGTVIPELRARGTTRFRAWSAGCSSGEEPYSIAITLLDHWPELAHIDAKILATDLDSSVVRKASSGIYERQRATAVDTAARRKWFEIAAADSRNPTVRVKDEVRELITFRQLNLMHDWPMRGPFQVIFCRNTVIYFDKPTQRTLFDRFAELQSVGDYLFIGHSETLNHVTDRYELLGHTVYRRVR